MADRRSVVRPPPSGGNGLWPRLVAWAASLLAVLLAALPQLLGPSTTYDPLIALSALSVAGLAWYTYFARQAYLDARSRDREERDRRRSSAATSLLAELSLLLPHLADLASGGGGNRPPGFLAHPMLEKVALNPELFYPGTVQEIHTTLQAVRDPYGRLESLARYNESNPRGLSGPGPGIMQTAMVAYNAVARLVPIMQAEGGSMPAVASAKEPLGNALLPNPFDIAGHQLLKKHLPGRPG